ncbi:MAG: asparagine synthase (glutamine-hydrolyzing) [Phycisphaerae bacterium]|nr:asparagine synthase (glutamine-hydrolyzing) [Phycisphaerae bacterium]|tara:strand:+ start:7750 stop:9693 length:1944 start_codon:yes stop_codon:yes gene_type:complete
MCGICGIVDLGNSSTMRDRVWSMSQTLEHRGPDDGGVWISKDGSTGLGHRRLSIIDCTQTGKQPMYSKCGRYVIVYNGEIYNFESIRSEIESDHSVRWEGYSDTEVLLEGISTWGFVETIKKTNGMFAIAAWDFKNNQLLLARDRLGEKPLYYGWNGTTFVFASELKAIKAVCKNQLQLDEESIALFLRFSYIPAPWSIYKGIYKLEAGTTLSIDSTGKQIEKPKKYWDLYESVVQGTNNCFTGSQEDAVDALEFLLENSIRGRMLSDVPLGAFLSGGIDSTTVVAMMQEYSSIPVKTFTIGSTERGYNEASFAMEIAKHLGTDHTELIVEPSQAQEVIPLLPKMYDEPFADSSQIPTYLVSKLARSDVTVALSGDGGDELFGGYNRHFWAPKLWNRMKHVPAPMRAGLSKIGLQISPSVWNKFISYCGPLCPDELKTGLGGERVHKFLSHLSSSSQSNLYQRLVSVNSDPASLLLNSANSGLENITRFETSSLSFQLEMMFLDMSTYLPDDILAKVDRASMSVSLETRLPLLDHKLVEFAWSIPMHMKIREGKGKWLLKQLLYRKVPQAMMDRPKLGFGIPLEHWLRGPLKEWAGHLLSVESLRQYSFFNPTPIRKMWQLHSSGKRNFHHNLWNILTLQAWLEANK